MSDEFGQNRVDRLDDEIRVLQEAMLSAVDKLGTCNSSIVDDIRRIDEQISFIRTIPSPERPRSHEWRESEYIDLWEDSLGGLSDLKVEYDRIMLEYRDSCKCPASSGVVERELNEFRMNIRAL